MHLSLKKFMTFGSSRYRYRLHIYNDLVYHIHVFVTIWGNANYILRIFLMIDDYVTIYKRCQNVTKKCCNQHSFCNYATPMIISLLLFGIGNPLFNFFCTINSFTIMGCNCCSMVNNHKNSN